MMGIGALSWDVSQRYAGWQPAMVRVAAPKAQPDTPVQPVQAAKPVSAEQGTANPLGRAAEMALGFDPAEMAVRSRIAYVDGREEQEKTPAETMEEAECQTCKNRKYQDGSDDPGVSFKTPGHIAPEQAASKVRGHEMEHVIREQAKAVREDRKVVSQTVTMHTAICPECGRVYVSGGTTRTATVANNRKPELYEQKEQASPVFEAVA